MTKTDIAYIAGIIDGEGYVGIKKTKAYPSQGRKTPGYHARLQVRMTHEGAIRFLADTLGGSYYREKPHSDNGKPLFCYQASDKKARTILSTVLPYLKVKIASAETVLALRSWQSEGKKHRTNVTGHRNFVNSHGTIRVVENRSFSDEYVAKCEQFYLRCKELNAVGI